MRTVKVDDDHVATFTRVSKKRYAFTITHTATQRDLYEDVLDISGIDEPEAIIIDVARRELTRIARQRLAKSEAYARGEVVAGAPAPENLPPAQRAQIARGGLDVAATLPVRMIRDAYQKVRRNNQWVTEPECVRAAIEMGRSVLIGATDEQIIKIARGQATLEGSLREGVRYKELP